MSKTHKIYFLLALSGILLITSILAILPYATFLSTTYPTGGSQVTNLPTAPVRTTKAAPNQSQQAAVKPDARQVNNLTEGGRVEQKAHSLLVTGQFRALDKLAKDLRNGKRRVTDGGWALSSFYTGVSSIYKTEKEPFETDSRWSARIEQLKRWKMNSPKSVTARIALAKAYINQGWFARGTGTANTVSAQGFQLLEERINLADDELFEAQDLDEKCPEWFSDKLLIARVSRASKSKFEEIFRAAIAFEPGYQDFYREKSEALKPKWGGSLSEWRSFFANIPEIARSSGSDEGPMLYLLVSLDAIRDFGLISDMSIISKEINRTGYQQMSSKYGVTSWMLNEFAYLSVITLDGESARAAFEKIGDKPDPSVWTKEKFYRIREMVETDPVYNESTRESF